MPGFLLDASSIVTCSHGGTAQAVGPNPRVIVSGSPTVTMTTRYVVDGCAFPRPPAGNGPCAAARFITAAARVTSNGQPLVLADSRAPCVPTGTLLVVVATQKRVAGT